RLATQCSCAFATVNITPAAAQAGKQKNLYLYAGCHPARDAIRILVSRTNNNGTRYKTNYRTIAASIPAAAGRSRSRDGSRKKHCRHQKRDLERALLRRAFSA